MALQHIFVAYDGSEHSKKALEMAKDIAVLNADIQVDIVNVVPIPLLSGIETENLAEIIEMMMEDGKKTLLEAQEIMASVSDQISTFLLKGTAPAVELLKMIEKGEYDLVIIGNRGLSGIREFMGSVSYKVLHQAKIPVLVME